MDRKEFLSQVGIGAAALLVPFCGGLAGCSKDSASAPANVDFTVDVSQGALATNGGSLSTNGIVIARTTTGSFLAVSAACTHEGVTVKYNSTGNNFSCPRHGAKFDSNGAVTQGPANSNLRKYNTSLNGTTLRVYS